MCGLMRRLATFHLRKEWALREGKEWGTVLERSRHKVGSLYGKDNIVFIMIFSCDVKSRRKLYFA
jgi:hypothetical protein